MICDSRDPETGECMRRFTRCSCNPPRCEVCGRFVREWGDEHVECLARIIADEAVT